jgi:hypothetical protein
MQALPPAEARKIRTPAKAHETENTGKTAFGHIKLAQKQYQNAPNALTLEKFD